MRKRRKWLPTVIFWLVLLAAVFLLVKFVFLPLFDNADEGADERVVPYGYEPPEEEMALENEILRFALDPETTQFSVTDKRSGAVWYSSPQDVDADAIALPVEKHRLKSALTITYSMSTGMQTMLTSDEYSVENKVYEVAKEGNAIVVRYSLGRISRTYVIPPAITEERMNAFTANMSKKQSREVLDYYEKKSLSKLKSKDDPEALLAMYPDLAENTMYILRDNIRDNLRVKIEGYFAEAGYTREEYEYDLSRCNLEQTTSGAVFNVSLRYELDGADLIVTVPLDEVAFSASYPIVSLSLLPGFGAGGLKDEGYMLMPDGMGAVIRFNNGKTDQNAYYSNVYGWDWASLRTQVTNETNSAYPAFGIARNGASFLCVLEEGAPWTGLSADISGRYTSYNTAYASYTLIHGDPYDVSDRSNNANYLFERDLPEGNLSQRYRFLTTDTVAGMAESYRERLTAQLPENRAAASAETPVNVEFLGAIDKVQQRFGIPTTLPVSMTSYRQAAELFNRLKADGLTGFSVRYTGWMNGGVNQKILNKVKLLGELGSEADFRAFALLARQSGTPLYLDGLTAFARHSGLLDGFITVQHAAKLTTQENVALHEYSTIWYGPERDDPYYLLKPALMKKHADVLSDAAQRYQAAGVSYRDVGAMLSSDYNRKDLVNRVQALALHRQIMTDARDRNLLVMTRKGCDFTLGYSDLMIDMDFDGGNYGIVDYYAPFYPMAIHGLANYTGVSLNLADDWESLLLQSAESGSGLSFTLTAESTQRLQSTVYSSYYGADSSLIYDRIKELWQRYSREMAGLNPLRITDCERIGLLAVTTYENGTRVYVNYGYEPVTQDGVTVPARDYLVAGKEGTQ
ncbi:MAG: hypothetical protein IKQ41_05625 [Clostridia bacterium]|nr:hypothetical protein [Clostridia bacterium]